MLYYLILQPFRVVCILQKEDNENQHFYRALHYSAKHDLAIACHLSVRLSVTLVDQDHIDWKSWKLIAQTISPTPSLFIAERPSTYSQGNMGNLGGDPTDHA